jgi:hypothetical protein
MAPVQKTQSRHASWQELLEAPAPSSHIAQIYDSDDFVAGAVGYFAAEGLRRGEAVFLTGTPEHLRAIRRTLDSKGLDSEAALRHGQLTVTDVRHAIDAAMGHGRLDAAGFQAAAADALTRATDDARYTGVRWWGEITNVLHQQGHTDAGLRAEDLGGTLAREHGVRIFCSFLCDRFDPRSYDDVLTELCCKHSHVIPAEDYVRHRLAVNRAIAEVIGEVKGPLLQSLLSWKGLSCELPSSQALLFWVREALPEHFHDILARVKSYQVEQSTWAAE